MQLKVKIENARLVRQGLENTAAQVPRIGRKAIYDRLQKLVSKVLKKYPPPRPGQRYKRTFRFKRSWRLTRHRDDGWMIRNDARAGKRRRRYGKYVVGDAVGRGQAWMHKGRWFVMRDKVEEALSDLPKDVTKKIHLYARRQRGWKGAG